ncbi:hypothetical protein EWB00_002505 [Schistosoma japonicum]|uniref:Uncharacterized protein n=1 Tax=Schistosoma japonicum TaxID=6182 RepID=A0A4Z2DBV1_SCHJA|nr:hypothetical protein EWB00_002505 [Schistosoma japonicum]
MQIDEIHKTRISLAGTQSIKTAIHHKEIQADTGFRVESKFIPKAVNDVICQVGQVKSEVSTQSIGHTTTKPMCRNIGVDPISLLEKKVTTDVITQTGIVHTSKVTQAELMQEQPVYVKAIETQDVRSHRIKTRPMPTNRLTSLVRCYASQQLMWCVKLEMSWNLPECK